MKELPVALVCRPMAIESVYSGFVLTVELAASLGGRNTWLNAPPVMRVQHVGEAVVVRVEQEVGLFGAGTTVFTVRACEHQLRAVDDLLLGAGEIEGPAEHRCYRAGRLAAQQTVAFAAMSRSSVTALTVTVCACRLDGRRVVVRVVEPARGGRQARVLRSGDACSRRPCSSPTPRTGSACRSEAGRMRVGERNLLPGAEQQHQLLSHAGVRRAGAHDDRGGDRLAGGDLNTGPAARRPPSSTRLALVRSKRHTFPCMSPAYT